MGSTFHLSNWSGETLTRLTAAQGLCLMEQIEPIVFLFFLFQTGGHWGGVGRGRGQLGMRDRVLDPAWYDAKIKGYIRKLPPQNLKDTPNRHA